MSLNYNTLKSIFFKFDHETAHKIAEVAMVGANKIFPGSLSFLAHKCVVDDNALKQNLFSNSMRDFLSSDTGSTFTLSKLEISRAKSLKSMVTPLRYNYHLQD